MYSLFVDKYYDDYRNVRDIFYFSEILEASDKDKIFLLGLQRPGESRRDILLAKLVNKETSKYDVYIIDHTLIKLGTQYGNKLGEREFIFNNE